jgi:hypothetical protein
VEARYRAHSCGGIAELQSSIPRRRTLPACARSNSQVVLGMLPSSNFRDRGLGQGCWRGVTACAGCRARGGSRHACFGGICYSASRARRGVVAGAPAAAERAACTSSHARAGVECAAPSPGAATAKLQRWVRSLRFLPTVTVECFCITAAKAFGAAHPFSLFDARRCHLARLSAKQSGKACVSGATATSDITLSACAPLCV